MKALKIAAILPWLLLISGVVLAATQYGEAVIERGSMTIIREGQTLSYDQVNRPIAVNEEDLIRVRADSLVKLQSRENATLTLGSNSVFEVKPWQAHGRTGFLRALFGRFRAAVATLSGGEQFNVKTATATIGVKGTQYLTQVTNRGGTMLIVTDHVVGLQGQTGNEFNVSQGHISLVINFRPPTPPAPVPAGVTNQINSNNLNSPEPNSNQAGQFAGANILIQNGIVTPSELQQGEGTGTGTSGAGTTGGTSTSASNETDIQTNAPSVDANAASNATRLGNVKMELKP